MDALRRVLRALRRVMLLYADTWGGAVRGVVSSTLRLAHLSLTRIRVSCFQKQTTFSATHRLPL
jgi:hypothetical protein